MKSICVNVLLQNTANVTVDTIADFRSYLLTAIPSAKITWCPDNNFMFPGNKNAENALVSSYLGMGDEIAIGQGFPAVDYPTLPEFQGQVNEWFDSAMQRYGKSTTVACAWHYPASYLAYLVTRGIRIATGTVWSQTGVDRFQGEGTKLFPYYPSATNASVPGSQDIVLCNSLSPDPLGCRVMSGDSRWTLHPADPEPANADSQKHILDQALLQEDYPLFVYPEIDWLYSNNETLSDNWKRFVDYLALKPVKVISMKDFDYHFRKRCPDNKHQDGMVFTGSGLTKGNSTSSSNLKQYWYEDQDCSVCLQEDLTTHEITCEACVHYVDGIPERYGYFLFNGTRHDDFGYKVGLSYKADQFRENQWKVRERFKERAMKYFGL